MGGKARNLLSGACVLGILAATSPLRADSGALSLERSDITSAQATEALWPATLSEEFIHDVYREWFVVQPDAQLLGESDYSNLDLMHALPDTGEASLDGGGESGYTDLDLGHDLREPGQALLDGGGELGYTDLNLEHDLLEPGQALLDSGGDSDYTDLGLPPAGVGLSDSGVAPVAGYEDGWDVYALGTDVDETVYHLSQICLRAPQKTQFMTVIDEKFNVDKDCKADNTYWDAVTGKVERIGEECKLVYVIPKGTDEVVGASVESTAKLSNLTKVAVHRHLKLTWTEHFTAGYEFPFSQKLARFSSAVGGGHVADLILKDNGKVAQGALYVRVVDAKGKELEPLEAVVNLELEKPAPTGSDIAASLEAMVPTTTEGGWIEVSFNGTKKRATMKPVANLSTNCIAGFDSVWVGGNWTNRGTKSSRESIRYIDNVVLSAEVATEKPPL